ncbi:MAG: hypothetical protein QOJ19_4049 [Acidimicrobiia bacterium]|jgi:hypothetical protein|nr:hypothetical protein [Acidimicrobiia bacterium]
MLDLRMRTKPRGPLIVGGLLLLWIVLIGRWATTSFDETIAALDLQSGQQVATVSYRCPSLFSGDPDPVGIGPPNTRLERQPCADTRKQHRFLLILDGVVAVVAVAGVIAWSRHHEVEVRATLPGHPRD